MTTNSVIHKGWLLATLCLLTVMLNFDLTAVNLAIPPIAQEFHAKLTDMQWVINAFVLATAMFQILGGRLGDLYGLRRNFMLGIVLFALSSALAGFAGNESVLIGARALQGVALGIALPTTMALIYRHFPPHQQAFAVGIVMATMGVSLGIGPTLGGFILHYLNWRWIFWVNIPVGILAVVCTLIFCPKDKVFAQHAHINPLSASLLVLSLFAIVLPLNQAQSWGILSTRFWLVLSGGIGLFGLLFLLERRNYFTTVDFRLFRNSSFTINVILRTISQAIFVPVLFFVPIYLQNIVGVTPFKTGLYLLFVTLVIGALSPLAGRWVTQVGSKYPNALSMCFYAAATVLFYQLTLQPHFLTLMGALMLIGVATAINFVSTTNGALTAVPQAETGMATGIFFTIVWTSCALGIAVTGTIMAMISKSYLLMQLTSRHILFIPQQLPILLQIARGMLPAEAAHTLSYLAQVSFMHGFRASMTVLGCAALAGIACSLLESPRKPSRIASPQLKQH